MKHCFMMRSDVKRPPRKSDMRNLKPATHLAILYANRRDGRKSPGVPGAAIAIFADRRDQRINSPALAKSFRDFLRLLLRIASKANPSG